MARRLASIALGVFCASHPAPAEDRSSESLEAAKAHAVAAAVGDAVGDAWKDARNPIRQIFQGARLDLWSFNPVTAADPPAVRDPDWCRGPLDRFIAAKRDAAGLAPASEADRRTLIRRLAFDLTGMPPSPDDVRAFIEDPSPDAYERLAERLMGSAAFGEHWGRMWLDVVRYSDSNGYDWDEFRPQAWRFRDYVIRAFNEDKPFDRFIHEQLAGDELVDGPPRDAAAQDSLVATGYLRVGPWDNSSKLFGEEHKTRAQLLADLTETTASAFLGMTFTCCRCHDHKTDPLSQADHYRFRAFFAGVEFADDLPLDLAPAQNEIRRHNSTIEARLKDSTTALEAALEPAKARLRIERKTKPDAKISDDDARKGLTDGEKPPVEKLDREIAEARKELRPFTTGLCMKEGKSPPPTHILSAGDPDQPKEAVEPGFLTVFNPQPATIEKPPADHGSGRRLTLARWITAPDNPLTARVLVNRFWQHCFGLGIVATPGDFGYSGARPSHPELLDWLAAAFVRSGWRIKPLVRMFVTSATYRQASYVTDETARADASRIDAGNALLWRMNPRRLSAEQLRDALLGVSGRLAPTPGGPAAWPVLPQETLAANPAFFDDNAEKTKGWYPSPPERLAVRSVYLVQKRSVRIPFMETFDLPENFLTCSRRNVSTVAPQAFALLNNPFAIESAKALAERVRREAGDDPAAQSQRLYQLAFNRPPSPAELRLSTEVVQARSLDVLARIVINTNEFIFVD